MFQKTLRHTARQMGQHNFAILMVAPLQYLLITDEVLALEKVSFSDRQNPKTVCLHIDSQ